LPLSTKSDLKYKNVQKKKYLSKEKKKIQEIKNKSQLNFQFQGNRKKFGIQEKAFDTWKRNRHPS
jgi:hypothetical protein